MVANLLLFCRGRDKSRKEDFRVSPMKAPIGFFAFAFADEAREGGGTTESLHRREGGVAC